MSAPSSPQAAALLQRICRLVPTWEYGALGSNNALRLITTALQHKDSAEQGARLALFAWQDDPLDVRLARMTAQICASPLASHLARWCALPPGAADLHAQTTAWTGEDWLRHVPSHLAHAKHGGFWLKLAFDWCLRHDIDGEYCRAMLDHLRAQPQPHAAILARRLWAAWALLHLSPEKALAAVYDDMPDFALWQNIGAAHCLHRLGQSAQAIALFRRSWSLCPCHPNLVLALYQLTTAPRKDSVPPPPLALYSWNKADVLAATLESLRHTEAVAAPVLVLDNGSDDHTSAMLQHMQSQWPVQTHEDGIAEHGGLRIITLPVNVGAPAARNWLLSQPEVRQREEVLFLDDDLVLTPGWLNSLCTAAGAHPKAAVLGCRVTDHTPPYTTQSADFFFLPQHLGQGSFLDMQEHIFAHCGSMGSLDNFLTAYERPCLSVSGCCHWLRLGQDFGGPLPFDVRFTPSQFDDLERDMRHNLAGRNVLYVGTVSVRHVQHSSLRQAQSRPRSSHIFGNKIKLEHLYSQNQIKAIREHSAKAAQEDLLRKITRLTAGDHSCMQSQ